MLIKLIVVVLYLAWKGASLYIYVYLPRRELRKLRENSGQSVF